jgi:hypothetical protein
MFAPRLARAAGLSSLCAATAASHVALLVMPPCGSAPRPATLRGRNRIATERVPPAADVAAAAPTPARPPLGVRAAAPLRGRSASALQRARPLWVGVWGGYQCRRHLRLLLRWRLCARASTTTPRRAGTRAPRLQTARARRETRARLLQSRHLRRRFRCLCCPRLSPPRPPRPRAACLARRPPRRCLPGPSASRLAPRRVRPPPPPRARWTARPGWSP